MEIRTGDLKHKIQIGKIEEVLDDDGFSIGKDFVEQFKTSSKVDDMSYKAFYSSNSNNTKDTVRFCIRYRKGINYSNVIRFKDIDYAIENIDNLEFKNEWLVILASSLNRSVN